LNEQLANGRSPEARAFREERVIAAAAGLARNGGYEAVQMREVAAQAEVSLSTLYRYYDSKDEILRAVVVHEVERLRGHVIDRPPRQRSPHGRAAEVLVRAFHAMLRDRGFAHAVMSVNRAVHPIDAPPAPKRGDDMADIVALAAWGPAHRVTKAEYKLIWMLLATWSSAIADWLNGSADPAEVEERLRFASQHILRVAR
jgi:AcrR family transcriptional regulator